MELFNVSNDCVLCTHRSQSRPIHFVTKGIPVPLHFINMPKQRAMNTHRLYEQSAKTDGRIQYILCFFFLVRFVVFFLHFHFDSALFIRFSLCHSLTCSLTRPILSHAHTLSLRSLRVPVCLCVCIVEGAKLHGKMKRERTGSNSEKIYGEKRRKRFSFFA